MRCFTLYIAPDFAAYVGPALAERIVFSEQKICFCGKGIEHSIVFLGTKGCISLVILYASFGYACTIFSAASLRISIMPVATLATFIETVI